MGLLLSACAGEVAIAPAATTVASPPVLRPVEPSTPHQVRAEIFRWFSVRGYPPFQAAALMEHARVESGFRPCARGPGGFRYTFQWGAGRLRQLHAFARMQGCPPLETQLAFADHELRNDPKFSCFLRTTTPAAAMAALRRGFGRGSC